ncbi:MAG: exopolyphosphatase [Deltaproteobacteria bacterium]|jgi:nanoRNase/pAp phosphatase (c-di-AMP/oligoRNAs hydrolase)|nr:exopolyphosphatase [Deltaproteobacteria bacterium]MBT4527731.1 exopolyphosphatase [Deltaproteobacteria bacterium]
MRLLTRSDFDGLACAVLLEERGLVDEYLFVHPKDIQDGLIEVTDNDILANIPFVKGCKLWFDHHVSEVDRLEVNNLKYEGASHPAPSAAQVIWDYYGGEEVFGSHLLSLLEAVNKTDAGFLTREDEIINPDGWILLSFIMDPRTGLGRFKDYRIANYQLMMNLIGYCRSMSVDQILDIPDVKERTVRYFEQQDLFIKMLKRCCLTDQNIIVNNLLDEEVIYCGNRFIVYSLFPEQNIEIRIMWGRNKQNVVFAVGHSITNRSSLTNVGELMYQYGGGGHEYVGTCQIPRDNWEVVLKELIDKIKKDS